MVRISPGRVNPGSIRLISTESTEHQAGTDQKDERQSHLHNYQHVARAVPFPALGQRAAAVAEARRQGAPIFQDRNQPEAQPGKDEDRQP